MSFQFDLAAAEKLPKLCKEESRALREGYEKDVALLQRDDASFIPVLPIDEQGRLKRANYEHFIEFRTIICYPLSGRKWGA